MLNLLGDLWFRGGDAAVEQDGGDPSAIKFVEVAFPDVPAQLEAGNIDAAWVPEPFVTQLKTRGDALVVEPYQAVVPGLATLTAITTTKLRESDAKLVADFSAAMKETLAWAQDSANEAAVRLAIKDNYVPAGRVGIFWLYKPDD